MKTKKALKKLDKVESLLSSIIEQFNTKRGPNLREALDSAKKSVIQAKETVDHHKAESKTVKKPPAKAAAASLDAAGSRGRRRVRAAAG